MLDRVRAFVADELKVDVHRLGADTTLGDDLGVDGDDGIEIMQEFALRFAVDMSAFQPDEHFGPEAGWNPLAVFYDIYYKLRYGRERSPMRPITLSALAQAAERGRWEDSDAPAA